MKEPKYLIKKIGNGVTIFNSKTDSPVKRFIGDNHKVNMKKAVAWVNAKKD